MTFASLFYWLFVSVVEEDNSDDEEIYRQEKRSHSEVHSIMYLKQHLIIIHMLRSCKSLINNYIMSACWI